MSTLQKPEATWYAGHAPAANTQAQATKAAVADQRHCVTSITVSADGTPSAVRCTLKTASTEMCAFKISANAFSVIHINFKAPLRGGVNEAITLTLPALGAGVSGEVFMAGYSRQE